jgi:hypothetical protein
MAPASQSGSVIDFTALHNERMQVDIVAIDRPVKRNGELFRRRNFPGVFPADSADVRELGAAIRRDFEFQHTLTADNNDLADRRAAAGDYFQFDVVESRPAGAPGRQGRRVDDKVQRALADDGCVFEQRRSRKRTLVRRSLP